MAELTPRQKVELYFHKRDKKDGHLVPPDRIDSPFPSEVAELAALETLNKALGGTLANFDRIKEGVRNRWASREPVEPPRPQKTFGGT